MNKEFYRHLMFIYSKVEIQHSFDRMCAFRINVKYEDYNLDPENNSCHYFFGIRLEDGKVYKSNSYFATFDLTRELTAPINSHFEDYHLFKVI